MDDQDVAEIQRLLAYGFPKPSAAPALNSTPSIEERRERYHREAATFFDGMAHMAVNQSERRIRELMRDYSIDFLLHGRPLPVAMRAWLIYVLSSLEDMPHGSRGRPESGLDGLVKLNRLAGIMHGAKRGEITARLKSAAEELCSSYEKVRAMYYSAEYKKLVRESF